MPYGTPDHQSHRARCTLQARYQQTDAWVVAHIDQGPLPTEADADEAWQALVDLLDGSPDWTLGDAAKTYDSREDLTPTE